MDEIVIESLRLKTRIGVNQWEQKIEQTLLIDLHIYQDFANIKDSIEETINYDTLCREVEDYVTQKSFQLVETVANEVATEILSQFPVRQVKVVVNKPHALKQAKNVKVIVIRSRLELEKA